MISYSKAPDLDREVRRIVVVLGMTHIDSGRVVCVRSFGSKSRRVLARIHTLPRIMQNALDLQAHYVIEVITENFDRLGKEEKTRTLIHEVMHIPKSFRGGFRHHRPHVNKRSVERMYSQYKESLRNWL